MRGVRVSLWGGGGYHGGGGGGGGAEPTAHNHISPRK